MFSSCNPKFSLDVLAGIPVEGKSSVCLNCINNYRIIILITGVLSLSARVKYFLSYIANTSRTHARRHARAHTRALTRTRPHAFAHPCAYTLTHMCTHTAVAASPPYRLSLFGGAQSTVTARSACDNSGRWPFKSTHELATRLTRGFGSFSRIKKLLGRTETRTSYRMYCQAIRIVRDISRDDRAGIATYSLRTLTDRLKENYSIELGGCPFNGPLSGMKYPTRTKYLGAKFQRPTADADRNLENLVTEADVLGYDELEVCLKALRSGKVTGCDNVPVEAYRPLLNITIKSTIVVRSRSRWCSGGDICGTTPAFRCDVNIAIMAIRNSF